MRRWLTGSPVDLAVFRIVVFSVALLSTDVYDALEWAEVADRVRASPFGIALLAPYVPLSRVAVIVALAIFVPSCVLAIVGALTRASTLVATLALFYLLAVPHLAGVGMHAHHLLWFAALLCASPCGDALSIDAWRKKTRAAESISHGVPVRAAWVLIGLIFLFPGVWKWSTGLHWAFGGVLRGQVYWKWAEHGWTPALRVDLWPHVLESVGLAVMVFEPLVFVGLLFRRTRPFMVVALLIFHLGTSVLMRIDFPSLWLCYLVFIPWHRVFKAVPDYVESVTVRLLPTAMTALVATFVIFGVVVTGVRGIERGFPFASYPRFHQAAPKELIALSIEVHGPQGTRVLEVGRGATQREWAAVFRDRNAAADALLIHHGVTVADGDCVRVHELRRAVDPSGWDTPARRSLVLDSCAGRDATRATPE